MMKFGLEDLMGWKKEKKKPTPEGANEDTAVSAEAGEAYTHLTHSGSGDNVAGDKIERQNNYFYPEAAKTVTLLTEPPFNSQFFIGRDADMADIKKDFEQNKQLLILVNGEGGMGKTTLAAKYWVENLGAYTHAAWLVVDSGVANALLKLADKLSLLPFDPKDDEAAQIRKVTEKINQLPAPCLLVFDNANDGEDLENRYATLRKLLNCHILITSRVLECYDAPVHFVRALDEKIAIQLFRKYYDKYPDAEAPLLKKLLEAVGFNTLVVEVLAKNMARLNEWASPYGLQNLLDDLINKGLFGIKTKTVQVAYQSETLRIEKPENIIAAMYELSGLQEDEKRLLSNLAVLPAENIPYERFAELLQPENIYAFGENLTALGKKGWIEYSNAGFKISPVVQEIVRQKNKLRFIEDVGILMDSLVSYIDKIVNVNAVGEQSSDRFFLRYAESIVNSLNEPKIKFGELCLKLGEYYSKFDLAEKAYMLCERKIHLFEELVEQFTNNLDFKNGLALCCQYLGGIDLDSNNLDRAITYYELENKLLKDILIDNADDSSLIERLEISYASLRKFDTRRQITK